MNRNELKLIEIKLKVAMILKIFKIEQSVQSNEPCF